MSSGVWSVIFLAGFLLTIFILTNFRGIGSLGRSRSRVPGLRKRATGPKCGTYSIKFYPDQEALAVQTTLHGGGQENQDTAYGYAKIVTFFTSFELFHYGNGSPAHDTSGPLREQVRAVLNNTDEPTWNVVEWNTHKPLFHYDGELFRNALTVPGILGIEPYAKDLSLVQGVKALVGQMVNHPANKNSPEAWLVRRAVTQLLDWQDQFGPPFDMGEAQDRASQAWEAALRSAREAVA